MTNPVQGSKKTAEIKRKDVDSTMISSIGYDRTSKTLEIEFNSGYVYRYFEVPAKIYKELKDSSSKGTYFLDEIKDVFTCLRLG